ncbi:MAG: CBS domain-containing protein [Gemmatimonadetes bacterium]|nr:MAG: CBS domain-containing protein [Gemmatimonadota bacterium]
MEIITTHTKIDFDGMASMIAAHKLYPDAIPVRLRSFQPNVKKFLSLHRDIFRFQPIQRIPVDRIHRIILVDTSTLSIVENLAPILTKRDVDVIIYDHHPRPEHAIQANEAIIRNVGATTTILVQLLKEKNIPLTPIEATAMALGIYADTGNLTYNRTTAEDVEAVAYLFRQGADVTAIRRFLKVIFTQDQKRILYRLIRSAVKFSVNNNKIMIGAVEIEHYIDDLTLVTQRLADIEEADAVFCFYYDQQRDIVYIIAKSQTDNIDVGKLMTGFGGGGHARAASAQIPKGTLTALKARLYQQLKKVTVSPLTVGEIMTSPVSRISIDTPISEVENFMEKNQIHGLPITNDQGELVGIISKTDVEKARVNQLMHAPVKGFMTKQIKTISPQDTLDKAEALMIMHNIGRLPVLDAGQLVGIITRTDVLKHLYNKTTG